jgi:hypothetical protein
MTITLQEKKGQSLFKRKNDKHSSKEKMTSTMKSKNTKALMRSFDPSFQFIFFKEERSELSK